MLREQTLIVRALGTGVGIEIVGMVLAESSIAVKIRANIRARGAPDRECCNQQRRRYRRQILGDSLSQFRPIVSVDRLT